MSNAIRSKISWGWLGLWLILILMGCSRGAEELPDIELVVSISPQPPQIGLATVTVSLNEADGRPITGAGVELEGNMSHAGMVPVFAQALELTPGRYQAQLEFTMEGDWFLLVRVDLPDGRSMERIIDVPGVDVMCGETPTP